MYSQLMKWKPIGLKLLQVKNEVIIDFPFIPVITQKRTLHNNQASRQSEW